MQNMGRSPRQFGCWANTFGMDANVGLSLTDDKPSKPAANSPRTAELPKPRNPREPLQTEEDFPNFGKSGCRDLHPGSVAAATALLRS